MSNMSASEDRLLDAAYAAEIRGEYGRCLKYSKSDDEAVTMFFSRHDDDVRAGMYDYLVIDLAQAMHRFGRLTVPFRRKVDAAAENLIRAYRGNPFAKAKFKKFVNNILKGLDEPQPEPRIIEHAEPFENPWQKGDAIAFKYRGKCQAIKQKYGEPIIYEGGYVILIFEKMVGSYVTGFVKLFNDGYGPAEKKKGKEEGMPFVKARIEWKSDDGGESYFRYDYARFAVLIEGSDQAEKTRFLGNMAGISLPVCEDNSYCIRVNFEDFAERAVHEYFRGNLKCYEVQEIV